MIVIQCTGFFEAGDAVRNLVHDVHIPLFLIVGVRSYLASRQGASADNCPRFTEPLLKAWDIPYTLLDDRHTAQDLGRVYRQHRDDRRAGAVLIAE